MNHARVVAEELSKLFTALSHPDRIRIIEELRANEMDVQSLSDAIEISPSRVSQHLSTLRALRLVQDKRDGKRHIYHLVRPEVANWVLDGLQFSEMELIDAKGFKRAVKGALRSWDLETT